MGSDVRLFLWNKHAGDPSGPAGVLVPQEQTDIAALLGPVLLAAHDGGGRNGLVHCGTPRSRRVTLVYSITSSASESEQPIRHLEPERLRGLEIDHQLEFGRL